MKISKKELLNAFFIWEKDIRNNPEDYEDANVSLQQNVKGVVKDKVNHLINIIKDERKK